MWTLKWVAVRSDGDGQQRNKSFDKKQTNKMKKTSWHEKKRYETPVFFSLFFVSCCPFFCVVWWLFCFFPTSKFPLSGFLSFSPASLSSALLRQEERRAEKKGRIREERVVVERRPATDGATKNKKTKTRATFKETREGPNRKKENKGHWCTNKLKATIKSKRKQRKKQQKR